MSLTKEREDEISALISQMTLEEKIGMIHGCALFHTAGVERLGIPPLYMSDGPMGVRSEFADDEWRNIGTTDDFVSYLPCNSAVASTWNRELAFAAGSILGEEARGRGKDVILAPGINVKRSPLCGRNFEYMSEDPHLIGKLAAAMIRGIQQHDVAACVKHFAANSQETHRLWVDTIVDERTLQEIYYPAFLEAIKEGNTYSLMGAYNLLNGTHCCANKDLLDEVLRKQWQYDGTIISDWGAVHDTVKNTEVSMDIEMEVTYDFDEQYLANPLMEKIKAGEIDEKYVDEKIRNILRMMLRLKMLGEEKDDRKTGCYNTREHQDGALQVAEESLILLKNDEQILPLSKNVKTVAVIGQNASLIHSNGGGSAEIKALYEISPLMGIKKLLGGNVKVSYAPGYVDSLQENAQSAQNWQATSTLEHVDESVYNRPESRKQKQKPQTIEEARKQALEEAKELASRCDQVIFVGGLTHADDVEGKDREDMRLPYEQDALIRELLKVNPNTVVVIYAGSVVEMPWASQAKSILFSYYAGMEGGTAIAKTLYGDVNPSGRLAETMIRHVNQCPAHIIGEFGKTDSVTYKEGILVGYRYYDTKNTDVEFCFGHGLSYSEFKYSDLHITPIEEAIIDNTDTKNASTRKWIVSLTVTNISERAGKEVIQLYVAPQNASLLKAVHELKGFEKVALDAHKSARVVLTLDETDFTHYDVEKQSFVVDEGSYTIELGKSSREILLTGNIDL